jgi:hypothetical protein
VRHPAVPLELNDEFLDTMERYFSAADVAADARPHLAYQVGLTPAGTETPRVVTVSFTIGCPSMKREVWSGEPSMER